MATVPPAPLFAPTDDILTTNSTNIRVEYKLLTSEMETGGATILSYNL